MIFNGIVRPDGMQSSSFQKHVMVIDKFKHKFEIIIISMTYTDKENELWQSMHIKQLGDKIMRRYEAY